jgi:hypothetical protein
MVLRTIGYTDNASVLVGQWPANYIALGQNLTLYANVSNDLQMNKASAAQMIYNVLTKQLVQVDANSLVTLLYDLDANGTQQHPRSLLTTGLDCYEDGAKVITFEDAKTSKIDLVPRFGAYGTLYKRNGSHEVVAVTDIKSQFLSGRFFVESNGTVKFQTVDGTKYSLGGNMSVSGLGSVLNTEVFPHITATTAYDKNTSVSAFFLNGDLTNWTDDLADEYFYKYTSTDKKNVPAKLIVAAGVSGLTITDLYSVTVWDAALSKQGDSFLYEAGLIDGKKFNGHDFPVDENNEVDHTGYILAGDINTIDDLAADNVVYVYKDSNGTIKRIDVGTETQSGTLTNVNTADDTRTLGGKVLAVGPYAEASGPGFSGLNNVGNEGTALLDVYGKIFGFRLGEASKGNFAVIVDIQNDSSWASGSVVKYKIFDKTGTEVLYELSDDSTVKSASTGDLIKYSLSGGKLLIEAVGTSDYTAGLGSVNKAGTVLTVTGEGGKLIGSGVLVYVKDGNGYSLGSIKDLLGVDLKHGSFRYIFDESAVRALVVSADDAGAQKVLVLIDSISDGWKDGEKADYISGVLVSGSASLPAYYQNASIESAKTGTGSSAPTLKDLSTKYGSAYSRTNPYPTIVKFSIDENGILKGAEVLAETIWEDATTQKNRLTILNAHFIEIPSEQNDGYFTIRYTTSSAISTNEDTAKSELKDLLTNEKYGTETFTSNAVLYKIDGNKWTSQRVRNYNFSSAKQYTFLKSASDVNGFDIIVEQLIRNI